MKSKTFVCYWNCEGFVSIVDCTAWERQAFMKTLSGEDVGSSPADTRTWIKQAMSEPEQDPQIWIIETVDSVTEDYLIEAAKTNKDELIDLITNNGKCLYSKFNNNQFI